MVIWVTNYKWWVGKSTICQNIAVYLAKDKIKVCIIDTDVNQASLNRYSLRSSSLPDIPVFFAPNKQILSKIMVILKKHYNVILIDWTPSNIELTDSIINYSSILLIPILPSLVDTTITEKLVERIKTVQNRSSKVLLCRFILNQATKTNNNKETLVRMQKLSFPVLASSIKRKVVFKRAYETWKGIVELKENTMESLYTEVKNLIDQTKKLKILVDF